MQEHTRRLGTEPLVRLLLRLSIPGMLSTITVTLYNTVDTYWVAKLGHEAVAALTIVMPVQMIIGAIGIGTGIGVTALVSRRFGEDNPEATNHVAGQIFYLSIIWGGLFILATVLFADVILPVFGATPDIIDASNTYMLIISFGSGSMVFVLLTSNLIRGSGDAVKPMVIMIGASVLNMVLDPLMILGIGPFPAMGIRGAALATVIAQSAGAAAGLGYIVSGKTSFHLRLRHLIPDMRILKDIYRVGAPATLLEVTQSVSFAIFNSLLSRHGSVAIAGVGMPLRISDLFFVPLMGASGGLLPIVGYCYGARNYKRLWDAVKTAVIGVVILLAVCMAAAEIGSPRIMGLFTDEPEILELAVPALRILLAGAIFIGPTLMFVTVFQGLSRGTTAMVLSLLRQFILFIPIMYLFSHFFGLYGVMWSLPTSDFLSFLLTYAFTYREYRKYKTSVHYTA